MHLITTRQCIREKMKLIQQKQTHGHWHTHEIENKPKPDRCRQKEKNSLFFYKNKYLINNQINDH